MARNCRNGSAVDGPEDVPAGPAAVGDVGDRRKDRSQRGAAEVRHAEDAEAARRVVHDGVERHDVGVLEPRQDVVFAAADRRDLQDDRPVGQGRLGRKEDPAVRPAGQFLHQPEALDVLADAGEPRPVAARVEVLPVAVEHHAQRPGPLRESPQDRFLRPAVAGTLPQAELFVD